jgi:L-malate glycosyltransferase
LASLAGDIPNLRLELAGVGTQQAELEQLVVRLGIAERVRFLGWQDDIVSCLQSWDIYASPSIAEGLGVSVLEAMAVGLPVVASAAGGLTEVVDDGITGFIVSPSNADSLAEALGRLARDADLRHRMGRAGLERVREKFSDARMVAEIESIYDLLLQSPSR